ncbi:hypothetical protein FHT82_004423 [Rhizobium sp. BK275]|nr:hypothetical protein [Rhizobium sp. BK275]MBB3410055.1 hypothetical protein [Rhizobium sp. BK316]
MLHAPEDEKLIGRKVNNPLLNYPLILWPAKTPALTQPPPRLGTCRHPGGSALSGEGKARP